MCDAYDTTLNLIRPVLRDFQIFHPYMFPLTATIISNLVYQHVCTNKSGGRFTQVSAEEISTTENEVEWHTRTDQWVCISFACSVILTKLQMCFNILIY